MLSGPHADAQRFGISLPPWHTVPSLSTVRIDGRRIGEKAAALVLSAEGGGRVDLGFDLVLRGSG